jgi:hypothetical protein
MNRRTTAPKRQRQNAQLHSSASLPKRRTRCVRKRYNAATLAWHYTTWDAYLRIVNCGLLLPTPPGYGAKRPIVWFSLNQDWEPTSARIVHDERGKCIPSSKEATASLGGWLVRLGLPRKRLIPWSALPTSAIIPPRMVRVFEYTGLQSGADPQLWMGCHDLVPIHELVAEIFVGNRWHRFNRSHR